MGTVVDDVLAAFRSDLSDLSGLVSAYCTVDTRQYPPQVHLWTLLAERDESTEQRLAAAERRVLETFSDFVFDFTTTHLQGRDPAQFIPEGALPVSIGRDLRST